MNDKIELKKLHIIALTSKEGEVVKAQLELQLRQTEFQKLSNLIAIDSGIPEEEVGSGNCRKIESISRKWIKMVCLLHLEYNRTQF